MLKTISAALLATVVIAAPALAAESGKSATQTTQSKSATDVKTPDTKATVEKSTDARTKPMNSNASMDEHRKSVHSDRHHDKADSAGKQLTTQPAAGTK
jgi:hypothetical protein